MPQYIADRNDDNLVPAIEIYSKLLPGSNTQMKSEFLS